MSDIIKLFCFETTLWMSENTLSLGFYVRLQVAAATAVGEVNFDCAKLGLVVLM
jgi:hypothetical protein